MEEIIVELVFGALLLKSIFAVEVAVVVLSIVLAPKLVVRMNNLARRFLCLFFLPFLMVMMSLLVLVAVVTGWLCAEIFIGAAISYCIGAYRMNTLRMLELW